MNDQAFDKTLKSSIRDDLCGADLKLMSSQRRPSGATTQGTSAAPSITYSEQSASHTAGSSISSGRLLHQKSIPILIDNHRVMELSEKSSMGRSSAGTSPRSRAGSVSSMKSFETKATSLAPLQQKGYLEDGDLLQPLEEEDLEAGSFDLVAPRNPAVSNQYSLEARSELIFSTRHLQAIFDDPRLLLRFTQFLSTRRKSSIPILVYYLDAIKALKAISYSNAIAEALEPIAGHDFTTSSAQRTVNEKLEQKAKQAFEVLARDDLPAFVTYQYTQVASTTIIQRITGTLPPHLREASEGLAEVFCLTDPSRPDNPIIFASEEFHRMTGYGVNHALGRNCRFLQGPKTNQYSVKRLRDSIEAGVEHSEAFLNYRRDGGPFMNLLMTAPLHDSRGNVKYFIGAQIDVSGLAKDCNGLEALRRLVREEEASRNARSGAARNEDAESIREKDEFQELSEMLNLHELEMVRRYGGRMHRESAEDPNDKTHNRDASWHQPRLLIQDGSPDLSAQENPFNKRVSGKLSGVYEHYLLLRPYPSLQILFASPSLRVPGMLQSPFLNRIGGSGRVREELANAMSTGRGVTAKVRWISKLDRDGRNRWIHCTPLLGQDGKVGVWMVVIVDAEEKHKQRAAPPVDSTIGRPKTPSRQYQETPVHQQRAAHHSDADSLFDFEAAVPTNIPRGQGVARGYPYRMERDRHQGRSSMERDRHQGRSRYDDDQRSVGGNSVAAGSSYSLG